jgi:hypothetical protein
VAASNTCYPLFYALRGHYFDEAAVADFPMVFGAVKPSTGGME